MLKTLCVVILSLGLASCGGSADVSAEQPALAAPAEGGCCSGCADEGAAPKADACCAGEEGAAKKADGEKAGACCSEGLAVPPAEPKKSVGQ